MREDPDQKARAALATPGVAAELDTFRLAPLALAEMDPAARECLLRFERLDDGAGGINEPRNVLRTVANSPATLVAWMPFMDHGRYRLFDLREREIVILRVSRNIGSNYGWAAHQAVARRLEALSDDEIGRLLGDELDTFVPREQALIAATDDMTCTHRIGRDAMSALRAAGLTDAELVDLVMLAGEYMMVGMVTRSFDVPLDAGLVGLPMGAPKIGN
ncbi:MAG: Carboxymuconolactone decarboxylase [Bradyrhizobium sp.]|nr:Carboxymuconolactone decarboxylase [Bradyrhizobium sp.]